MEYLIDITRLKSKIDEYILLDDDIKIDEYDKTKILDIKSIHIKGDIFMQGDSYYMDVNLFGKLVLPSSLTLEPVDFNFNINIDGDIYEMLDEIGKTLKNDKNTIDIFPIIWENILMEIPIRVEDSNSKPTKLEGNGWKLITED